jgi:hypothetical protein
MKALKSRRVQETTRVDSRLDEKLASLIGGDLDSVSKARAVVARLDDETASRLDRVTEIKVKSLAQPRRAPTPVDRTIDLAGDPPPAPVT